MHYAYFIFKKVQNTRRWASGCRARRIVLNLVENGEKGEEEYQEISKAAPDDGYKAQEKGAGEQEE